MRLTRRGRLLVLLGAVLGVVAAASIPLALYLTGLGLLGESDPHGRARLRIPQGATASSVGSILARKGVIASATGWRVSLFLNGGGPDIQAGEYRLAKGLTPEDALAALQRGPKVDFVTVTFPEGSWLTEMAQAVGRRTHISRREFHDVVTSGRLRSGYQPPDVDTLEGLLFPSTYQVVVTDTAKSLATRLAGEFEEQTKPLAFARAAERLGRSPYEAIIVASMIEAETRVDSERGRVARVIYNRLRDGMVLGIDATVVYALGERTGGLTATDLEIDSPYNTRRVSGLPPTPIGAPGLASLEAALSPAPGSWLYYVLTSCEGTHSFSESYEEFLDNKAAYESLDC